MALGDGIRFGSSIHTISPERIQLIGVSACFNNGRGINLESGWDIQISDALVANNGVQGIYVSNEADGAPLNVNRVNRVQISNALVYDNGQLIQVNLPGIALAGVNQVLVDGGRCYKSQNARWQNYGVGLFRTRNVQSCDNIRILDLDYAGPYQAVASLDGNGLTDQNAVAQHGYTVHRLSHYVAPICIFSCKKACIISMG